MERFLPLQGAAVTLLAPTKSGRCNTSCRCTSRVATERLLATTRMAAVTLFFIFVPCKSEAAVALSAAVRVAAVTRLLMLLYSNTFCRCKSGRCNTLAAVRVAAMTLFFRYKSEAAVTLFAAARVADVTLFAAVRVEHFLAL